MVARVKPLPTPWFTEHIRRAREQERESGFRDGQRTGYRRGYVDGVSSGRFIWIGSGLTIGILLGAGIVILFINLGLRA